MIGQDAGMEPRDLSNHSETDFMDSTLENMKSKSTKRITLTRQID